MIKQGRHTGCADVGRGRQILRLVPLPEDAAGGRNGFAVRVGGKPSGMRFGNLEVRPLGGGFGCLLMVLFSVVASVVLTVLINLLLR
jgi:hypothetical protein